MILSEKWLPVLGWEGFYEVSDMGRVRSIERVVECSNGRKQPVKAKVLVGGRRAKNPYRFVALSSPGREREQKNVSALVLEAFVGPRPAGQLARHLNDVKDDDRLENLAWGTVSENAYDRVNNGSDHNARKTHCANGHFYDKKNTYIKVDSLGRTSRSCAECARDRYRRSRAG